jgi:hypothetical protein
LSEERLGRAVAIGVDEVSPFWRGTATGIAWGLYAMVQVDSGARQDSNT